MDGSQLAVSSLTDDDVRRLATEFLKWMTEGSLYDDLRDFLFEDHEELTLTEDQYSEILKYVRTSKIILKQGR